VWQEHLEDQKRNVTLGLIQKIDTTAEQPDTAAVAESLEAMDDESLNRAYRDVMEHRARQRRQV